MTNQTPTSYPRGTTEYVSAIVTGNVELEDAMTVEISLSIGNPPVHTWLPGEWEGADQASGSGPTARHKRRARTASALTLAAPDYPLTKYTVYTRVSDNPEVPIMKAGVLTIDA